jgi:acylphosphatase
MSNISPAPTEDFRIIGTVGAAQFPGWIVAHAAKLGLTGGILSQSDQCVEMRYCGPPDLLDALAVGCSLGPREVWVDRIDRVTVSGG